MNPKYHQVLILVNSQAQKAAALHYLSRLTDIPVMPGSESSDFHQYDGVAVCNNEICGANKTIGRPLEYSFENMHQIEKDMKSVSITLRDSLRTITITSQGLSGTFPDQLSHSDFEQLVEEVNLFNYL